MLTVHPSIVLGSYLWDEERLPRDEFDIRMDTIRSAIKERGWAGALVYGDAREHAALAYFSNFIPRMRWAMALFPAQGAPVLLASMSSRDMPAMRTMTWLPDVKSGWEWRWFDEWVASLPTDGKLGAIGLELMTPLLFGSVSRSIEDRFEIEAADELLTEARSRHRPREIAVIGEAAQTTKLAEAAIIEAWRGGADVERAALAGERRARSAAAQDVRTLVSRDGGLTMQPYAARFEDRPANLLVYVAVKHLGYWCETFVAPEALPALRVACDASLDKLIEGMRPGERLSTLASHAQAALEGRPLHPVLSGRFGRRVGLSLDEGCEITSDADGVIEPGLVYALHSGAIDGASGCISSAVVLVREGGTEVIFRSSGRQ
ncbi:MAG: M24 family metallopeptidase [Beijerinckiaceae bacterium]|nr:M24 family metallopeptidase [Beijerinckiaceae bacterium]